MIEKKVLIQNTDNKVKIFTKSPINKALIFFCFCFAFICIFIMNDIILISIFKKNTKEIILNQEIENFEKIYNESNINLSDEFFHIPEVIDQIKLKHLSYVTTIGGGKGKIGNALLMLNNLINICEQIKCKNIVTPEGLQDIIKKPIFYDKYNITIFPNNYNEKLQIDINLSTNSLFYFHYKERINYMRLGIIREELFRNIPKINISSNDLYIHIRSGDIFINDINPKYPQPPLCFYQKIINENKFANIFILSNGNENPVIRELLKLYPKITFIEDSVINDISKIVNAYNLVLSRSTFVSTLITFNTNVERIYIYEISYNIFKTNNYTKIYKMLSSPNYKKIMKGRWQNTKEQLNLMIVENCTDNPFIL